MNEVLRLRGVIKAFDGSLAVDGISLDIESGERVAIIGPNGAGKTTTLLMSLGMIEADEGTIELAGYPLPSQRASAMHNVGFAAGYLPMPDRLRVDEALTFFGELFGVESVAEAVDTVIEELQLAHVRNSLCRNLSSGQRTLVGIAKAVLHAPELLVLDEPTASLDPDIALRVRDRLADQSNEHGTTLLLTSHDMREVEALTTRVIFLRAGQIIADGPAAEIAAAAGFDTLEQYFLAEASAMREVVL